MRGSTDKGLTYTLVRAADIVETRGAVESMATQYYCSYGGVGACQTLLHLIHSREREVFGLVLFCDC
jgi:hypothetical protein